MDLGGPWTGVERGALRVPFLDRESSVDLEVVVGDDDDNDDVRTGGDSGLPLSGWHLNTVTRNCRENKDDGGCDDDVEGDGTVGRGLEWGA